MLDFFMKKELNRIKKWNFWLENGFIFHQTKVKFLKGLNKSKIVVSYITRLGAQG